MLFSNSQQCSAHQISRVKSLHLTYQEQKRFLKMWFGSGKWLFFFRQLFSAYLNAVCIQHQDCLLYWDFTTCYSCQLCWVCSAMGERAWLCFDLRIIGRIVNFTPMAEIFGNDAQARKEHNLTFRSQAECAVLPAKENMDLAPPPRPSLPKKPNNIWN